MTDQEQKKVFANNLTNLISASGKTQKEVAKDLGVNPQTLNVWCTGKSIPKVSKIQMIADYFKVGKSQLVDQADYSGGGGVAPIDVVYSNHDEKTLIEGFRTMPKSQQHKLLAYYYALKEGLE